MYAFELMPAKVHWRERFSGLESNRPCTTIYWTMCIMISLPRFPSSLPPKVYLLSSCWGKLSLSFINPRNPDAGAKIHLRTGEVLSTKMAFDQLSQAIDEAWESSASLVLSTLLSEKAKLVSGNQRSEEKNQLPEEFEA